MCMWVIKFFSNSCGASLTYVIHHARVIMHRATADCIPEFSIRARIFTYVRVYLI